MSNPSIFSDEEWYNETFRRMSLVMRYFKTKKEVQVLYDFLETAKDVSKEENESK